MHLQKLLTLRTQAGEEGGEERGSLLSYKYSFLE
jgi:hypothetical protein